MEPVRKILNSPYTFWALLALPSVPMLVGVVQNPTDYGGLLHSTGEFAARFMIIAMMLTPLRMLLPKASFIRWLMARRRHLGVAAFGYAALHTAFYLIDVGTLSAVVADALKFGIWTGWVAFLIFIPLAITSNNASLQFLNRNWKPLQRFVYPAAVLTLLHWMFVHNEFGPALVHFVPLAGLEAYRIWKILHPPKPRAPAAA